MERSLKTIVSHKIYADHPLFFPDGVQRTGDVYLTTQGEWYAVLRGVTYALQLPLTPQHICIQEGPAGNPVLKRIEL